MSTSACSRASAQQLPLGRDAVGEPAVALQRVRPADALEAADQHLVVGVDEHHARVEAALLAAPCTAPVRSVENARLRTSSTIAVRRAGAAGRVRQLGHLQHQRLRQVVDDVVADVLQRPRHRAAAAARDTR